MKFSWILDLDPWGPGRIEPPPTVGLYSRGARQLCEGRLLTFLRYAPTVCSPFGPRWCFGSSSLTTNPNTCTTKWDYHGSSAVSHTWFSFNSKYNYLRIPLPTWLEYLGNLPGTRQSQMHRLFTWPVCLRLLARAPLHRRLFTGYSGIVLNSIMLTSNSWIDWNFSLVRPTQGERLGVCHRNNYTHFSD